MTKIKDGYIIHKAYRVYHDGLLCGDSSYDKYTIEYQPIVHANTIGEAKSHGLGLEEGTLGRPVKFTDIRVVRVPDSDIVFFEGEEISRCRMDNEFKKRKRTNKMKKLPDNEYFYVQDSRTYVGNAVMWWAIDSKGYTTDLKKAHKFTKQEIIDKFGRGRDTDVVWIGSHVEKAIREYVDAQFLKAGFCV